MRFNEFKIVEPSSNDSMGPLKYVLVQKHDSLYRIAKALKIPLADLIAANPQIKDPDLIHPGDKINVPGDTPPNPVYPEIPHSHPRREPTDPKDDGSFDNAEKSRLSNHPEILPIKPGADGKMPLPPGVKPSTAGAGQGNRGASDAPAGKGPFKLPNAANAKIIFDHFKKDGFNDIQCAAWVGNFVHESGADPEKGGDWNKKTKENDAWGIAQWRDERFDAMKKALGDRWTNLSDQLKWATFELSSIPKFIRVKKALNNFPDNLEKCVEIIQNGYEIPSPDKAMYGNRLGFARTALELFGTKKTTKPT